MSTPPLLLAAALLAGPGAAPVPADFALQDGDTVVFLGDSITAARTYGKLIENYTLLRFPGRKVRFINAGRGGDTAAGGLKRLEQDVFAHRPTVLTVAYGVNDIGWGLRADEAHRKAYLDGIRGIVQACVRRGVRVYVCSAAATAEDPAKAEGGFLQRMCDEGMALSRSLGGKSIDVQRSMREVQRKIQAVNRNQADRAKHDSLHVADGVHLNDLGQLAMAYAILKGLGAPADVSSVAADAAGPKVLAAKGCKVTDLEAKEGGLEFTRLDEGLPFNYGLFYPLHYRYVPVPVGLNLYLLKVTGLAEGKYEVTADGRGLGTFTAAQLAAGVNLASATADPWRPGGPWDAQAAALKSLTDARHEVRSADLHARLELPGSPAAVQLEKLGAAFDERVVQMQRAVAKPQPYRFVIRSLGPRAEAKPAGRVEALTPVKDPPPVQVLVPGFTVRELPVELTNVNNVKYRPDGTLVALGYDGRVWLLRDSDGDGIEDKATLFWENKGGLRAPIGMDLTPPGYRHGDGLFVVGKTKLVLIADTDGDGKADRETELAGGWKESFHAVDGLGVAFDPRDGSVYYGRGTYNFADPLLRDKAGKSHYSRTDESGSILRVWPDFKKREVIATGLRFPVGLRLNRHGDLFATDQEGATWVPNGNPLDELLHIQKGRHYGFPARHPKHLPDVIDEPSTFDYGPQHQSACGLAFNEPVKKGGPIVGPGHWAEDVFVTGQSRGKLYRTRLVKTRAGYVARTQVFACLNMLTVDVCVTPDGGLLVACHSGGPDWGSGPSGKGKLFKISHTDRDHPQPVLAWPAGPRELRVEFDRPVDPDHLRDVLGRARLLAGRYARAGDRFESLTPGYVVVQAQKLTPRYRSTIRSAQLTPDRRTLVLATDANTAAVHYALTLPGMGRPPLGGQHPAIDLDYDLTGCEATWTPGDGGAPWTGWLPHLDLQVARELTAGSATHDALWAAMRKPGELRLRAQLDLTDMLRPAVQPGSRIDYEWPPETVTVAFDSDTPLRLTAPGTKGPSFSLRPGRNKPVAVELTLTGRGGVPSLVPRWTTAEDTRPRPLPLRRILLPWADASGESLTTAPAAARPPELDGGSWGRGRKEYFGEQAGCAKCHAIHGQGGDLGPDLSNLVHRDYASVLRDVTNPSFAINPDHVTYVVTLKSGRVLTGVVRTVGGRVRVGDSKGEVVEVRREAVERMTPSAASTMPEGIPKQLGPERLRDLMTFLLTPPPSMPRDHAGPRPPPRPAAKVRAILAGAPSPPEKTRPIRVVLVAGPKDHGPGEHDYPAWQKAWAELLRAADRTEVVTAWGWPAREEFRKADVMVFYQHGDWDAGRAADVDAFLERGGGLVYIHWAIDGRKNGLEFAKRTGLAALGMVKFRHGPLTLTFDRDTKHPVIRNFDRLTMTDESYWKMVGTLPRGRVLGRSPEDGEPTPQMWSLERGRGRVFVSIPGHYSWTFDDPLFRVLLLRGIAWSAKEPVDRFNDLVWPGADVTR